MATNYTFVRKHLKFRVLHSNCERFFRFLHVFEIFDIALIRLHWFFDFFVVDVDDDWLHLSSCRLVDSLKFIITRQGKKNNRNTQFNAVETLYTLWGFWLIPNSTCLQGSGIYLHVKLRIGLPKYKILCCCFLIKIISRYMRIDTILYKYILLLLNTFIKTFFFSFNYFSFFVMNFYIFIIIYF